MEGVFPFEMNGNMFINNQNKTAFFTKKMTKIGFDLGLCFSDEIKTTYSRNHKQLGTLEGSL